MPSLKRWHFPAYLTAFAWCSAVVFLTHASMLFMPHAEGDEIVYYTLATQMNWDLSRYTTTHDPRVSRYPYTIYNRPLFHQPPLYPLILKIGSHFRVNPLLRLPGVEAHRLTASELAALRARNPLTDFQLGDAVALEGSELVRVVPETVVATAFLFAVLITVAAIYYAWRLMVLFEFEPRFGITAMIGLTIGPLLLFSTVRLHHDALAGLMLLCGLAAFAEALARQKLSLAIQAAIWLVAALNTRFNMLAALPVILAMPLYGFSSHPRSRRWLIPAIVLTCVLTLGLQHYYRLLACYGTLWPGSLIQPLGDAAATPFLRLLQRTTRGRVLFDLLALFPLGLLLFAPWNVIAVGRGLRKREWPAFFVTAFAYLFLVQLAFAYKPVRYFAAVTPLLHASWPLLLRNTRSRPWLRWNVAALAGVTLLLSIGTGYVISTLHAPDNVSLVPSIAEYWPPWRDAYTPR